MLHNQYHVLTALWLYPPPKTPRVPPVCNSGDQLSTSIHIPLGSVPYPTGESI